MPKKYYVKNCKCREIDDYVKDVLTGKIRTSEEIKLACGIIKDEFESGNIYVNNDLLDKYIKIGYLFFPDIFPFQKFLTAVYLCTFYKGTKKARWRKILILMGRGNGKDGMIAWWSCCLTSKYHGIKRYDIDIIANNMTQSLRPIGDIEYMIKDNGSRMKRFFVKTGDSVISLQTDSVITTRSSDAKQQDGLRSGCIVFNEIHMYENYSKYNVMRTGLGKKEDPRIIYFTTNGDVRGGVLDDLLETSKDILHRLKKDRGFLPIIYKLDAKEDVDDEAIWVKANPSLPYRDTLYEETADEYEDYKNNPDTFVGFMQKRMNLPEMSADTDVASWDTICLTSQEYDLSNLKGKNCVVGIDCSKTTDWTGINFLFYDDEIDKFVCINHAFICASNRDLRGIKAPWQTWVDQGYCSLIDDKEVNPELVLDYMEELAEKNDFYIQQVVIDEYKKGILSQVLSTHGYTKEAENLKIVRPRDIAPIVTVIERGFLNEKFIWNNPVLRWACNNTKLVPWQVKSTGTADMGNRLYGKKNARFRKTDPFMAFVHSMVSSDSLINIAALDFTQFARAVY